MKQSQNFRWANDPVVRKSLHIQQGGRRATQPAEETERFVFRVRTKHQGIVGALSKSKWT